MLKVGQMEDGLFLIELETPGKEVKFRSVFRQVDGISPEKLVPAENGLKLSVKFPGEN